MSKNIQVDDLQIGQGTVIHPDAVIRGLNGKAKSVILGSHCYIGKDVQIICDDFSLGDYSKIHHNVNIHGYKPCRIGHNVWIGQYSIIDSIGGMSIGNNVGVGAHSQLWSHIKYGDTLEGCRFLSDKAMKIGNDVWFVGHCIVSPINAEDRSMAMVGSVVTKDMKGNEIYAGSPAKSISDKIGYQFLDVTVEEKYDRMNQYLEEFTKIFGKNPQIKIIYNEDEIDFDNEISYFSVDKRVYSKKSLKGEIEFMKFLLPDKAKFVPVR